jgi:dipeptidyl aminopeptidase/acylaminoacyl peptidase
MITEDALRGIRMYRWSEDSKFILYLQDVGGDENFHLFAQPIEPGADARDLTPGEGVRAQNLLTDKQFPQEVLVGLNKRNPQVFDMYRVNLASGESELDTENPGDVLQWVTDADFQIRGAVSMNPADGSTTLRTRQSTDDAHCSGEWKSIVTWPQEENGGPVAFTQDGASMYVESSLGVDTTRLIKIDATTGKEQEVVTYNDKADVGQVVMDDNTRKLLAVSFNYLRKEWKVLDPEVQEDFEVLRQVEDTDFSIGSSSQDEQTWVVSYSRDNGPTANYVYDRRTKKATLLFVNQPALSEYQLSHMEGVVIKARDGLELPAYLSLPVGTNKGDKLPLVLNVHGGPWARDFWGYRPDTQWLTNRGYAVLQVNFRGSTGYGKSFLHKGDKQWGVGTMQHDLTDAVQWAIDQGIADPKRVAIYGGSYGGYACLAGLTFTPDVYCCGVDVVGPSNIQTLFKSIPPYWAPLKKQLIDRVGDVESDEALNKQISPLYHIDNIKVPLLIGQGANDPRVKQAEADQIYEAMKAKGLPVAYYLYKDEGHGFARPPNRLDFYSRVEHFLVEHLGGRAEDPLKVHNTSVVVIDEGHAKH